MPSRLTVKWIHAAIRRVLIRLRSITARQQKTATMVLIIHAVTDTGTISHDVTVSLSRDRAIAYA